ncbi:effector binding domain-containing protein [Bacillus sp. J37]|uniref:GyrI-like domain-containing protein n=1 Tax=Bacillus sp. J37 TaxID=935837 RepID=UPI00047DE2FF|nr:effector binding domain-containing protein [Bacillus sp. J37]
MRLKMINSIKTNNFSDNLLMEKITGLWKEASHHLPDQDMNIYGVYHDYESDYKGDYRLSIAIEDSKSDPSLEIPDHEKYEIFKVDAEDEQGIINTWKMIWERENSGGLKRAYTYDFEKYAPDGEVKIYIAIK